MNKFICPICGTPMVKNGHSSNGAQRWKCTKGCKHTKVKRYETINRDFQDFCDYLEGNKVQRDMPGEGRSFRRRMQKFWELWPLAPIVEKHFDVLFADGIYLRGHQAVILIVCGPNQECLGWYVARAESEDAWIRVLRKIAAPKMVVCDGGRGFAKAVTTMWPHTKIQRCFFHISCDMRRASGTYSRSVCAQEFRKLSYDLCKIETVTQANSWLDLYGKWKERHKEYLAGVVSDDANRQKRLIKAKNSVDKVISDGHLFNYLTLSTDIPTKSLAYNNYIEGAVNSCLRDMLRKHRGSSPIRRIKMVFYWCYLHSPDQLPIRRMLEVFPTDDMLQDGMHPTKTSQGYTGAPEEWGEAVVWDEFHLHVDYRSDWN